MIWIIAIVIILVILAFLKFEHHKKTIHITILILILGLIYFSMSSMIKSGQMDFSSPGNTMSSLGFYMGWVGETSLKLVGIGKDTIITVGNVIKGNETEFKK
jgi:hypothetical protein